MLNVHLIHFIFGHHTHTHVCMVLEFLHVISYFVREYVRLKIDLNKMKFIVIEIEHDLIFHEQKKNRRVQIQRERVRERAENLRVTCLTV